MFIVAGTDFSEGARSAARAAAAIAKKLDARLKLVHVADEPGAAAALESERGARVEERRRALAAHAEELHVAIGAEVEPVLLAGDAEHTLVTVAADCNAELLVVASHGKQKAMHWLVGSVAERVAQLSRVPAMVVRDPARLESWARGERPLRVMVCVEPSSASRPALRFAARLRKVGRADLTVVQAVWPFGEHLRLGVPLPIPVDHFRPELQEPLLRDLRTWVGELPGVGETTLLVSPSYGRVDRHLAALAAEHDFDLVITAAHRRSPVARLWQGSVSRGVLHQASGNVACVPHTGADVDERDVVRFRRVLVPTDFSPLGQRAVAAAYAMVVPGGVVHLVHVVPEGALQEVGPARARLRDLIPLTADERGVESEVEVVEQNDPALAITQAAARYGVDVICMATHGRSGVSRLALGSQAEQVVRRSRHPVLLVPAEREGDKRGL